MIDKKRIFIANLSKGKVGEAHAGLLGSLIVTGFELAAFSRADCSPRKRTDFFLYADEFQLYATDSFASLLSEARKYRLSLTLAHQYLGQLGERIRDAIFGNVGTFLAFRVSEADAPILARQFGGFCVEAHFTGLDNFEVCAKLLNQESFLAKTLPPLQLARRRRDSIVKSSRRRYSKRRKLVEERIERWLGNRH